ncbi:phosphatase PAP2 family protein [Kaistella palustris]|uniref:phosphatase PAP2 family protein n=1 Tax=Kaistella palustris TaxID=493376 RepID=UPI00040171D2|nr:phosphatase PAP2 family protein [Kaistella palustris]
MGVKTSSVLVLKISKVISGFFNPLTSLLIYFLYASSLEFSFKQTLFIFLPILLFTVVPITVWIIWNVKKGRYTNLDVSDRRQRKGLYFFIAGALSLYLLYDFFVQDHLDFTMIFILLLLVILQVSNYFIKSSMHTAFNVFVAALFFALTPPLGTVWLCMAIVVGITRVVLKKHSVKEVFTGGFIAVLVSFIYLYTHIQLSH